MWIDKESFTTGCSFKVPGEGVLLVTHVQSMNDALLSRVVVEMINEKGTKIVRSFGLLILEGMILVDVGQASDFRAS